MTFILEYTMSNPLNAFSGLSLSSLMAKKESTIVLKNRYFEAFLEILSNPLRYSLFHATRIYNQVYVPYVPVVRFDFPCRHVSEDEVKYYFELFWTENMAEEWEKPEYHTVGPLISTGKGFQASKIEINLVPRNYHVNAQSNEPGSPSRDSST